MSSPNNKTIISNSNFNLDKNVVNHMAEVVDVVEGEGEAEDRTGEGVAMDHTRIMEGTQTGAEEVDEVEAGEDIMMVVIK